MPSAEIMTYTAHTGRLGALGTEKLIVLQHRMRDAQGDPTESTSEVYFADRFADSTTGFSVLGSKAKVRAHLPSTEYVHWIDLLRHEDPVFLHWTEAESEELPDPDGFIHLATGPEPPGEGPIDLTP